MVGFQKFVEIGRVAMISYGPRKGRLVVIVDVIDQNRALVDGPCTGVRRRMMPFKRLHLTKFKLEFFHSSRSPVVKKAWEKDQISEKWAETTWAKKISMRKKRSNLSDFDRFKLSKAKQARNRIVRDRFEKLKRYDTKAAAKAK